MEKRQKRNWFSYGVFRLIRGLVWLFYPRMKLEGLDKLPAEPCVVVANHCQMNGPICGELYFPGERAIWCAGQMMELKEVPDYAYADFWSAKPRSVRWLYRILSYIIAPVSVCVFNNAYTIPVYRDGRVVSTFRRTMYALLEGKNVIVFPEHAVPHNNIINDFQDKFIDVARLYYKKAHKPLTFVPMYIAPELKTMALGEPIVYDPCAEGADRRTICRHLMNEITALALTLPEHTVVPYSNLPRKLYPRSRPLKEVSVNESTCGGLSEVSSAPDP